MDFVIGLPRSKKGNDFIWVVVDRLTNSTLFLHKKWQISGTSSQVICEGSD